MNLGFGPGGELYTAESGKGRVKRYAADGKFLGLVGYVGTRRYESPIPACSHIPFAVLPDASRLFVLDLQQKQLRVLATNKE